MKETGSCRLDLNTAEVVTVELEGVTLDSGCLSWSPWESLITFNYVL